MVNGREFSLQTCSNCKSVVSSQSEHCPACGQHLFVAAPVESLRLLAAAAVPHRFRRIFVVLLVAAGAAVFYRGVIVRETKAVRPVEVAVPSPVIAAVPELVDSGADTNIHAGLPTVRPSSRPTTYVLEPLLTAVSPLKIIPHRFIISEEDLGVWCSIVSLARTIVIYASSAPVPSTNNREWCRW